MLVECVCAGDPQVCICEASGLVHMTLVSERTRQWELLLSFLPFSLGKSQNFRVLTMASGTSRNMISWGPKSKNGGPVG